MKAPNNSQMLDTELESTGQQAIRNIVQGLPDDTLSMAWRSSLNERLLASAPRRPRFRLTWIAMPAAGAAVACALAVAVFFHSPSGNLGGAQPQLQVNHAVEVGLLDTYRQESATREIEGAGPDPNVDAGHPSIVEAASDSPSSEVDPDSL